MTELSRESGVPVPTIKYYMREGLVPPGERTSPNQAQYEQSHVRRLKLVRALIDVGGLSVAAAREVLDKMGAGGGNPLYAVGKAQYSTTTLREHVEDDAWHEAVERVNKLIADHGWRVGPTNPARRALADVLATLARLGQADLFGVLDTYADAASRLAVDEVGMVQGLADADSMAETVVIWTLLGDAIMASMRRLAQESVATSPRAE
ncbi:MerR family transcriptional regulator [Kutzneria sp. CA-103260]|uniref:MerR family transcriptional regulator n=1 Tax=Kutzneria sp. CA-103260 TaxID=2802641 RepID=UPI0020127D13|nr:MerR family transcriptional regulator [Kutzneria sp. CA-103260]